MILFSHNNRNTGEVQVPYRSILQNKYFAGQDYKMREIHNTTPIAVNQFLLQIEYF